jgi:hypothetical protein
MTSVVLKFGWPPPVKPSIATGTYHAERIDSERSARRLHKRTAAELGANASCVHLRGLDRGSQLAQAVVRKF